MKNAERPAYPTEVAFNDGEPSESYQTSEHTGIFPGLTKREYAAVEAMKAIIPSWGPLQHQGNSFYADVADQAIKMADELLKQLES